MEEFTSIENQMFEEDDSQNPDLEYEENYYLAGSLTSATVVNENYDTTLNNTG